VILKNDRELYEALLRGDKVEKIRHSGFGDVVYLKEDILVDKNGKPANLYRITPTDTYQTTSNYKIEDEDEKK